MLEATGVPTVVFRAGHIFGPATAPGPMAKSPLVSHGRASVIGPGTQRMQPVQLNDVVEAIVRAALDPATPTGTFELAGPDVFTVDEVVDLLNGGSVPIRHLPAWLARALAWVVPSLLRPLVDAALRRGRHDRRPGNGRALRVRPWAGNTTRITVTTDRDPPRGVSMPSTTVHGHARAFFAAAFVGAWVCWIPTIVVAKPDGMATMLRSGSTGYSVARR